MERIQPERMRESGQALMAFCMKVNVSDERMARFLRV